MSFDGKYTEVVEEAGQMDKINPGRIMLIGGGEVAPNVRRAYEWLFEHVEKPIRMAMLETAAGFEPNSPDVAEEVANYIRVHLQNFHPQIEVIPARKKDTDFSPDDPDIVEPLYRANIIMLGPGSPTYAVWQLSNSLTWEVIMARLLLGANLVFTSACTIASSRYSLPVYEIFKVGEDVHWKSGLDLLGLFGLKTVHIPHWNSKDGGESLDLTRCYMGKMRFAEAVKLLPNDSQIIGLDDHTALVIDVGAEQAHVVGASHITLGPTDDWPKYSDGDVIPVTELGNWQSLDKVPQIISPEVWEKAVAIEEEMQREPEAPAEVLALIQQRDQARMDKDWTRADELREKIEAAGWRLMDTPEGTELAPIHMN